MVGKMENAAFSPFRFLLKVIKCCDCVVFKGEEKKPLWEKQKMLFHGIFSFSHNAFKRPLHRGLQSHDCGKTIVPADKI